MAADHGFVSPFQHRALFDVLTMLRILGMYRIDEVVQLATSPSCTLVADAGYDDRKLLREHGFYWDGASRSWRRQVKECQLAALKLPFLVRRADDPTFPRGHYGTPPAVPLVKNPTEDTGAADAAALSGAIGRRFR